jgi:hypothetical protein
MDSLQTEKTEKLRNVFREGVISFERWRNGAGGLAAHRARLR